MNPLLKQNAEIEHETIFLDGYKVTVCFEADEDYYDISSANDVPAYWLKPNIIRIIQNELERLRQEKLANY